MQHLFIVDTHFLILSSLTARILPVTPNLNSFFNIMSTFYVISKGFLSKLVKRINQLINVAHRNIIEILRHAISFKLQIILTNISMLLQFHLQISLIARINPFSGCSHCLEASQVVCDANWLSGFSVMGISSEWSSRAICKIIFFYIGYFYYCLLYVQH